MDTLREDMAAIGGLVGCFVMRVCEWAAGVDDVLCFGFEGLAALLVVEFKGPESIFSSRDAPLDSM